MAEHRVKYGAGDKLVNELVEAASCPRPSPATAGLPAVSGRAGLHGAGPAGAELLFLVLTEREETNSVAIASNESFSGCARTFADPRRCAAIVDRLTFRGNIIETGTVSYRRAHARAQRAGQPPSH